MIKRLYNYIRDVYIRSFKDGVKLSRRSSVIGSELGSFVHVGDYAFVYESELGRYSSIGRGAVIRNARLGGFCSVSWSATIGATPHNHALLTTHAFHYIKSFGFVDHDKRIVLPTTVGNDVWVGANAVIMPGLKIGDGAVIGAGAVVTKDVPPYAIVAGVPAKILKFRFEKDVVKELLEIRWWDWEIKRLKLKIDLFRKPIVAEDVSRIRDK